MWKWVLKFTVLPKCCINVTTPIYYLARASSALLMICVAIARLTISGTRPIHAG